MTATTIPTTMHSLTSSVLLLISFILRVALAAEGDSCTYNGLSGTCQDVSQCTSGFTVSGFCPSDPANIECCVSASCTSTSGTPGSCLNTATGCSGSFISGLCPGPSDVQCCVPGPTEGGDGSSDVTVDFWINAFIPLSVPGVTMPYPADTSKSMIGNLLGISDCFLTDQRGFDSDVAASARMHSEATLSLSGSASTYSWTQVHYCGQTTEVDCEDGDVEGTKTQTNDNMAFTETSGSPDEVVLDFSAARNNPLWLGSPDIDLVGTLTVDRVNGFVQFQGKVDAFPAFEAYVSINGGAPQTIQQLGPAPGAGPGDLLGPANRDFDGTVHF